MRSFILLMMIVLPPAASGSVLSYDEIFIHYVTSEIRDDYPGAPDRLDGIHARVSQQVSQNWFVTGNLMYLKNDWIAEYRI